MDGSTSPEKDNTYALYIWNVQTGKLCNKLSNDKSPITSVAWDGRCGVVSGDRSGKIAIWT